MQVWLAHFQNGCSGDREFEMLAGIFDSEAKARTAYDIIFNLLDKLNDMSRCDWERYLISIGHQDLNDVDIGWGINPFMAGVSIKGPIEVK